MTSLGGGIQGISPQQVVNATRDSSDVVSRRVLRDGWNAAYATGTFAGHQRVIGPFRAVNNAGDFLARKNYVCGGPQPTVLPTLRGLRYGTMRNQCDGTGVPASACNGKYVYDGADYVRFKKLKAINQTYNDKKL